MNQTILATAWQRFTIISSIISDTNARIVATVFYFTILVPFGVFYTLFGDPMRKSDDPAWLDRDPVPTDLESAKEQG